MEQKYTLRELAELVRDKERELAPGSETSILAWFVGEYGYLGRILDGDSGLDLEQDATQQYLGTEEAYDNYVCLEASEGN